MADTLALHLNELRRHMKLLTYNLSSVEAQDHIRNISSAFDVLMSYLRKMMLGYENEQVYASFIKMEEVVAGISNWDAYKEPVSVINSHIFEEPPSDVMIEICENLCDIRFSSDKEGGEIVVGFDDEVETLLDQLTNTNQFQVMSIAGMAGLGKTTLARKLYTDPLVEYMFDTRAWICVSQVYLKRDLLLGILSSFILGSRDEMYKMKEEHLGEKLYRLLKGRKYLVVFDDIWDCMAWNDLKIYFPDDKVGSRVLFTSRDIDVSLHVGAARPAHVLRLRTTNESWDIFQTKVFKTGICPSRFEEIGRNIAEKCEGLPLAIVITAGRLKDKWSPSRWMLLSLKQSSFMVRDSSEYMESLVLSYNHLPPHLKHCFIFLGVFPEDYDIHVTKLIWLWIAQGLIHPIGGRILEDIAEDFVVDLITRSLLMIAKKKADGQVKACHIHDMLRDLCLRKAKEEPILRHMYMYGKSSITITKMQLGLLGRDTTVLRTLSGLCHPFELCGNLQLDGSLKSLRILDMESVSVSKFPSGVLELGNLRYLAIQARDGSPQASISNLVYLQILIIVSRKNIVVPKTIWNMVNLRHLYIKSGENLIEEKNGCRRGLGSLQSLSCVSPKSCHNISLKAPNLTKLGFCGPLKSTAGDLEFPNIRCLEHLQKLKLFNTTPYTEPTKSCNPLMFPENLRKVTLSNIWLDWKEMWTFACLPNLEVLKLRVNACIGEKWETSDHKVFRRLNVLKLHDLELRQWVSSSDNFPRLQHLVVHRCVNLESIPQDLGKIVTLDMIQVCGCGASAESSALAIQKEQELDGNYFLKVHVSNNH